MDEKVVRRTLSDDMLKHDISIRKAIKLVVDNAKEVAKKSSTKTATSEDSDK